ncbi:MAG: M23 family metallopeptidase [Desulfosalsimonadaceae bacterium]
MVVKHKKKGGRLKIICIAVLCMAVIGVGGWLFLTKFEGAPPKIHVDLDKQVLAAETEISGFVEDPGTGVQNLWIGLIQDGEETVLLEKSFPQSKQPSRRDGGAVPFKVTINAEELGLSDGEALLRMAARDRSWRSWGKGNKNYLEKKLVFDTRAPDVTVLTSQHNIRQGGSGLVVYRLSEDCGKSGVHVGGEFFPGHSGYFDQQDVYLALFALGYDQGRDTELYVEAVDEAGNTARSRFHNYIRGATFKKDVLGISDSFLKMKLPEFGPYMEDKKDASLIEQFLYVNQTLRRKNNQMILSSAQKSAEKFYWQGAFGRLPGSARRAGFADHRVYRHEGEIVDRAVHMGVDLASLRHAPVPAANAGKVVLAEEVGIYGNTVVIDHGYGLFSVYSHLSRFAAGPGEIVEKGDIIGHTGSTGFAAGDHLHYGMFIDHVYVNPVEWWDESWIANNITSKLENVQSILE